MKECESKRILTRKQCSMAKCSVLICRNGKCTVRKPLVSALQRAGDPLMETQRWLACLVFIGPVTKFLIPPYQVSFLSYCLMPINCELNGCCCCVGISRCAFECLVKTFFNLPSW